MSFVQKQIKKRQVNKLTADVVIHTRATPQHILSRRHEFESVPFPATIWKTFRHTPASTVTVQPSGQGAAITHQVDFTHKKDPSKTRSLISYQIVLQPEPRGILMTSPTIGSTQGEDFPDKKHYQAMQEFVLQLLTEVDPSSRAEVAA